MLSGTPCAVEPAVGSFTRAAVRTALDRFAGDVFLGQDGVNCTRRPVPGGSCGTALAVVSTQTGSPVLVGGGFSPVG